jgi:SAM-dependent methyltransferase
MIGVKRFGNPAAWDLDMLRNNPVLRAMDFSINNNSKTTKYPVRGFRYWFVLQLLLREMSRWKKPPTLCDLGVDQGQLVHFVNGVPNKTLGALRQAHWIAVSRKIDHAGLKKRGYAEAVEADLSRNTDIQVKKHVDVAIALHILEHLHHPEDVLGRIKKIVKPGGVIIGGSPVIPRWFQKSHEKRLRKKAKQWGHVSSFSSHRYRNMAVHTGLTLDFLSGTFFMRFSGAKAENWRWWARLNLKYGSLFPSYAGEVYWMFRRPAL